MLLLFCISLPVATYCNISFNEEGIRGTIGSPGKHDAAHQQPRSPNGCCERCRTTSTTIDRSLPITQHDGDDEAQTINRRTCSGASHKEVPACSSVESLRMRLRFPTLPQPRSFLPQVAVSNPSKAVHWASSEVELQQNRRYQLLLCSIDRICCRSNRIGVAPMPCCAFADEGRRCRQPYLRRNVVGGHCDF
jgi:hypothetical protein